MAMSDTKLRSLKPRSSKYRENVDEGGSRGTGRLLVEVHPSGRKVFVFRYIINGERRFLTLGDFDPDQGDGNGTYTLKQAREKARECAAILQAHGDVREYLERKQEAREAARRKEEIARAKQGTFGALLSAYVDKLQREGKHSARQVENSLRLHVHEAFPQLITRRAVDIAATDIHSILSKIHANGATRQVNKVRSHLLAAFNYGARAAYDPRVPSGTADFGIESNPVALTKRVSEFERVGERALSAVELRAYWRHLDQVPNIVVREFLHVLMLLGGQRIVQALRLRRADINVSAGFLRLRDSKGRSGKERDHLLPLLPGVATVLDRVPQVKGEADWVFSTDGQSHLRAETVSQAVTTYSAWLAANEEEVGIKVAPFTARDLRRTCETRLAELGVSKEVRAQLLSHGISGVQAKHYDQYSYLPEKRAALERWAAYLDGTHESATVVPLRTVTA